MVKQKCWRDDVCRWGRVVRGGLDVTWNSVLIERPGGKRMNRGWRWTRIGRRGQGRQRPKRDCRSSWWLFWPVRGSGGGCNSTTSSNNSRSPGWLLGHSCHCYHSYQHPCQPSRHLPHLGSDPCQRTALSNYSGSLGRGRQQADDGFFFVNLAGSSLYFTTSVPRKNLYAETRTFRNFFCRFIIYAKKSWGYWSCL